MPFEFLTLVDTNFILLVCHQGVDKARKTWSVLQVEF